MSQRRLFWRALQQAGVLESEDPRVQEFVTMVRESPDLCWPDLVAEFRSTYYDVYQKLVPALEASEDPFIRNMLIRYADPEQPQERKMLRELANTTDFERDAMAAEGLGGLGVKEIDTVLRRRVPKPGPENEAGERLFDATPERKPRRPSK